MSTKIDPKIKVMHQSFSDSGYDYENLREKMLGIRFSGNVGTSGYIQVGIYKNNISLCNRGFSCNRQGCCQACGCEYKISASGVGESVCIECGTINGNDSHEIKRAEQMYWACKEAGIVDDWEASNENARNNNYFFV